MPILSFSGVDGAYPGRAIFNSIFFRAEGADPSVAAAGPRISYVAYEGANTTKHTQITEVGWTTSFVSARVQAQNLQTTFQTFKSSTYVARSYWFDGQDIPEASLYYGIVNSGGTPKQGVRSASAQRPFYTPALTFTVAGRVDREFWRGPPAP